MVISCQKGVIFCQKAFISAFWQDIAHLWQESYCICFFMSIFDALFWGETGRNRPEKQQNRKSS
jgi:hypothetical protein